jgi:hypothetical protein
MMRIPIGNLVKAAMGEGKALALLIGVRCGIYPFAAARLVLAGNTRAGAGLTVLVLSRREERRNKDKPKS